MGSYVRNTLSVIGIILSIATSAFCQEYLYLPKPVENGDSDPMRRDGVLVREVMVKKRDTLSGISKKYSGRGIYYPQILLFNEIKNPHRIHPGDLLRVPVASGRTTTDRENLKTSKSQRKHPSRRVAARPEKETTGSDLLPVAENRTPSVTTAPEEVARPVEIGADEQSRYSRALAASRKGDCPAAIRMFDEFARLYPQSPLMPEAALNRAECYLKMSGS